MPVLNDSYLAGQLYTAAEVTAVAQAINGSGYLAPVLCATVGSETYTIASGSVTVINGTTLDGQSPAVGERILIKDAPSASGTGSAYSNQLGNGVYSVTNATTNLTVARVYEMGGGDIAYNPSSWHVGVCSGTVNGSQQFRVSSPSDPNAAMVYGTGGTTIQWQVVPSLTNAVTFTNKTLTSPTINTQTTTGYTETVDSSMGTVTATKTIPALSLGTIKTATLTASTACTFTMPTVTAGQSFVLLLKQAASTGAGTAIFTSVKWNAGGTPVQTTTAATMDIYTFVSDGTDWYGSYSQGYVP